VNEKTKQIALVDVPWDTTARPNPALSLLKALLERDGLSTRTYFTNIWLADCMSFSQYESIAAGDVHGFFAEWLFAEVAFPGQLSEPTVKPGEGYEQILHTTPLFYHRAADGYDTKEALESVFGTPEIVPEIVKLRDEYIPKFCRHVCDQVSGHPVVAFSCTLNQLVPALAVARLIKERNPTTKIVLGGVQVEGEMGDEILRIAPWIDAVYKGEAEVAVCGVMRWLLGEDVPLAEEYLSYRDARGALHLATSVALVRDMSCLATPDFSPYFEQAAPYRTRKKNKLRFDGLPLISSRGCWYGEKKHCTFCGLNAEGMVYRERSAEVVLAEVRELSNRYRVRRYFATDNIVPNRYFKTLFPQLAEADLDLEFFYETKANLKREQVAILKRAGVEWIQPGIESFSDHVLEIMRKGVTGLQNVYLLKLCREYEVLPRWNFIWGFPGEVGADYDQQTRWIRAVFHLDPPLSVGRFGLQRFSPFHFDSQRLGVKRKWASKGYSLLFPKSGVDLEKLAFYYDFEYADELTASAVSMADFALAVKVWRKRWSQEPKPVLEYFHGSDYLEVFDGRLAHAPRTLILTGVEMDVLLALDAPTGRRALASALSHRSNEEVDEALAHLERETLLIRDERAFLALPVRSLKRSRSRRRVSDGAPRSLNSPTEEATTC
jgi:ribosomal peptide maturation radical SAM protein 1